MRAAVLHEFDAPLEIEDVRLAPPGPEDVRVRMTACGICHSDIRAISGGWGGRLPAVYGHEGAGLVIETGSAVTGLAPGDTVAVHLVRHCGRCPACSRADPNFCSGAFALDDPGPLSTADGDAITQGFACGCFAEETVVHRSQAVRLPESLSPSCVALLSCGVMTGFGGAVTTGRVRTGESVAVFGTGGVGINSVQGAAIAGAGQIIAVDTSDEKIAFARSLGATHGVNAERESVADRVREITGGRGVDCAVATIVTDPTFGEALASIRRGGRLSVVGMADDGAIVSVDPTSLPFHGYEILGSAMGGGHPNVNIPLLAALHQSGRLRLEELITREYPFDRINDALEDCRSGRPIRNVITF